jgi:glutathione S-transferase
LVAVKLYVIPGSSPSKAAELMLDRKGIDYKRVDLVMAMHRPTLRMMGFPGKTVPALKADGRKVQGTRQISRFLDELTPGDRLVSSDAVAEAERWDDEQLQPVLRRLLFWALLHLPGKERTRISRRSLEGYRIGMPIGIASRTGLPLIKMAAGYTESTDENARAALAGLPEKIDRVDALLAEGSDRRRAVERGRLRGRVHGSGAPRVRGPEAVRRKPTRGRACAARASPPRPRRAESLPAGVVA